jgi:hypothetical protein
MVNTGKEVELREDKITSQDSNWAGEVPNDTILILNFTKISQFLPKILICVVSAVDRQQHAT